MMRGRGCAWKGESSLVRIHLHTIHRIVIREVGNKFKIMDPREGYRRCSCEVISFMDTLSFYVLEVTTLRLCLSVFYIGSETLAYRFKCVLAVCKRSSFVHHSWVGRVLELRDCNARFSEGNSVSLTMSTFRYAIRSYHNPSALLTARRT
jgi:hypothetical protein